MTHASPPLRRFRVYARELGAHHGRLLHEGSFEAAAVAYLEDLHGAPSQALSLVVRDLDTGHDHCFRIDLDADEFHPCG